MAESISVHVQDLSKNFGEVQALKDVNLKVESGKIFGL